MIKLPTIRLRHKTRGITMKVNQADYASDLGQARFAGWELDGGERHNEAEPAAEALPDATEETTKVAQEDSPEEKAPAPRTTKKKALRK